MRRLFEEGVEGVAIDVEFVFGRGPGVVPPLGAYRFIVAARCCASLNRAIEEAASGVVGGAVVKVDVFNPWMDPGGGVDLTEDGDGLHSSASATRGALRALLRFAHGVDAAQCAKTCVVDGGARAAAELALLAPALLPPSASGALVAAAADALCAAINRLGEAECPNRSQRGPPSAASRWLGRWRPSSLQAEIRARASVPERAARGSCR